MTFPIVYVILSFMISTDIIIINICSNICFGNSNNVETVEQQVESNHYPFT